MCLRAKDADDASKVEIVSQRVFSGDSDILVMARRYLSEEIDSDFNDEVETVAQAYYYFEDHGIELPTFCVEADEDVSVFIQALVESFSTVESLAQFYGALSDNTYGLSITENVTVEQIT
jgi:hypothetical protein